MYQMYIYLNQKPANAVLPQPSPQSQVDCDQQLAAVPVQNTFVLSRKPINSYQVIQLSKVTNSQSTEISIEQPIRS